VIRIFLSRALSTEDKIQRALICRQLFYQFMAFSKVVCAIPLHSIAVREVCMFRMTVTTIEIIIEHFKVDDWIAHLIFQIVGWSFKTVFASEQSSLLGVVLCKSMNVV